MEEIFGIVAELQPQEDNKKVPRASRDVVEFGGGNYLILAAGQEEDIMRWVCNTSDRCKWKVAKLIRHLEENTFEITEIEPFLQEKTESSVAV